MHRDGLRAGCDVKRPPARPIVNRYQACVVIEPQVEAPETALKQ
jgi:hypothetical protein